MTSTHNPQLLADWLSSLGLRAYEPLFVSNDIHYELLPDTTADDLRDIGITSVGHRRVLLQAIAKLQAAHPSNAFTVESSDGTGLPSTNLSIKPATHQHRLLTVMFCDLVGSTELSTQLDIEDLQQLLEAFRLCLREVIQKHKGYIAQYLGDGVLAYFGYPKTSESDCERALRAALDTLVAVQDLPLVSGIKLQVRVGLATGMVVIGQLVGAGDTAEVGAVGETPNLAARMQSLAPVGGIVAAESTRMMVGDLFEFRSLGMVQLKGFSQSHAAWEVLSEQKNLSRFRAKRHKGQATPLIGRDAELGFLRQQFDRSRSGCGAVVLLSGDAGTGKSHLVARLQEDIRADLPQAPLLQCSPDHSDAPLYPLINFITTKAKFHFGDNAETQREKLNAFTAEYGMQSEGDFYALATLLGFKTLSSEHMLGRSPDDVRERIQAALLRWLYCLVRDNMLVVVEDLHWADPSTLYVLRKFASELTKQHAMLIATTRPSSHDMLDKGNHINVLHLDRLPEADIRTMVQTIAAPQIISEQTLQLIVERSDGVPIFATELTRSLITQDGFSPFLNDRVIPQSLNEILLVRLDRLQNGRMTIEQASVLGREFDLSLLRACTQDITEDTEIAIEELLNAHLFVQHPAPNDKLLHFDHALVRDAVYQRMLRGDRERLHAKAAQVLERQFEASSKGAPHILALHYAESGNLERAVHCWQRAGDLAINQLAHQEAFSSYSRALQLLAGMPANHARDEIEFHLCMSIAEPLIAIRGSGSRKLAQLAQRAYDLCISTHHRSHLTSVQYLKWTVMHSSSEMTNLHTLATDIRKLSQEGTEADRLLAHRAMGFTCMLQGKLATAHEEFDSFLKLFDYEKYAKSVSFQFSSMNDISGAALAMATTCLLRKLPDAANHWRDKALAWALRSHNHVAICQSLVFSGGFIGGLHRRTDEMVRHMTQAHHFVTKHQLTIWAPYIALSMALSKLMLHSQPQSVNKHFEEAATSMAILLSQNGPYITVWAIMYARVCLVHDQIETGANVLARVTERINSGEKWMESEYLRLLANFQHAQSIIDTSTLRLTLRRALALAHTQGALVFVDDIQHDIDTAESL